MVLKTSGFGNAVVQDLIQEAAQEESASGFPEAIMMALKTSKRRLARVLSYCGVIDEGRGMVMVIILIMLVLGQGYEKSY